MIADAREPGTKEQEQWMTGDVNNRCFEVRNIRSLFLFTKAMSPEKIGGYVKSTSEPMSGEEVFCNGIKVTCITGKS